MIIHILANDGSPLGVTLKDLWGEGNRGIGVGGSEYALLTMCEGWHKAGHEVVLYNNPLTPYGSPFEQRNLTDFHPNDSRDVLVVFRSPNMRSIAVNNCLKVWWSCDQATIGDFRQFAGTVNKIVCISPRHADYFAQEYKINNAIVIDIPVRIGDYDKLEGVEKIKNRLIFTSVPGRGLDNLMRIYPIIQNQIPDVSLAITSDYRLWGVGASNEHFIAKWAGMPSVHYLGAVHRQQLVLHQILSQITIYPCNYDELFCVAIAESQYAGSYPITSSCGALPTTNMGTVIDLHPDNPRHDVIYAEAVIRMLSDPLLLESSQASVRQMAWSRFSPGRIMSEWNEKVFK